MAVSRSCPRKRRSYSRITRLRSLATALQDRDANLQQRLALSAKSVAAHAIFLCPESPLDVILVLAGAKEVPALDAVE